ncbi:MAG: hypothetical protein GX434_09365 [Peptococcaceae bacterium]|nr:hypothetical protein [Peptococcaceae bacterium]
MKSLVLAEKPSVAREIARVLQCNIKNKGFMEGPKYVVTWALGHLVTLAEPEDYDRKYKEWRMEDLPMLPDQLKLKVIRQTSQQYQVVTRLMKRADIGELVIATDAGREGELVARWIMKLGDWHKPFKRLWISSQTVAAILEGFAKGLAAGPYAEAARKLLASPLKPTKRLVDDSKVSDHHAIIPTEQPLKLAELTSDEKSLYDLIARRFLAVLSPPYRYDQLTVIAGIQGEKFYARGKVLKDPGWRAVTSHQSDQEENQEDALPEQTLANLNQGEARTVKNLKPQKGKTKPPARYTEATLLTAMENPGKFIEDEELRETMKGSGLGTPATRAEIIEKLLHTSYIERSGKELVPTSKGRQLINLVAPELRSPELTAQWEQALTDIARGKGSKTAFIQGIREQTVHLVKSIAQDNSVYRADNISRTKCPVCGKYMLLVNGKRGKMLVCQDRSCGHRQPEKERDFNFGSSKKASQMNQKLIARYSDHQNIGSNMGDLLKEAMAKQKEEK